MRMGLQPDATPEEVRDQLSWTRGELAGARRTIQHMSKAMGWISGHDRQGLDHLVEAQREGRARESAVRQARRWAARARAAEAAIERARALHTATQGLGFGCDEDEVPGSYGYIAQVCASCGKPDEYAVRWPCPTVATLTQMEA
ncbi:hypothetical protein AB0D27_11240 [Streptomyces sp. NPDC048415]|uniref:hypothetical protein n=1 Tax=Streptomyces sp. NPDC048415 TaxID=3154822 RepID=UPI0034236E1C